MNKKFSIIMMVLPLMAAVTSCTESDMTEVGSCASEVSPYISFDVQTQRSTRATTNMNELQNAGSFWIYSLYTGDKTWKQTCADKQFNISTQANPNPFATPEQIWFNQNKRLWYTNGFKLWPENGKTTFIAYYPAAKDRTDFLTKATENEAPFFTIPQDYQTDCIIAVSEDQSKTTDRGNLKIKFQHIKSRVSFRFKLDKPIDEDEFGKNLVYVKNFNISYEDSDFPNTGKYILGSQDGRNGYWDNLVPYKYSYESLNSYSKAGYYYYKGGSQYVEVRMGGKSLVADNYIDLFTDATPHVFLIPPSNEGIQENQNVVFSFDYFVSFYKEQGTSKIEVERLEKKSKVALPKGTLKPGASYKFNLILDPLANVVRVDPEVEVESWGNDETMTTQFTAADNEQASILDAWNKLADQSQSPDSNWIWYKLIVSGNKPAEILDLSTGNTFKNASTTIELIFTDGGLYATDASKLKLPAGYYLDTTVTHKNLIRYSEAKKDEAARPQP